MRKYFYFITLILTMVVLVACSSGGAQSNGSSSGKTILKVAHFYSETHPQHIALVEKFEKTVEEKTEGKIDVEIYPSATLGDEEQFTNGVRNGTIQMSVSGMGLQNADPRIGLLEVPFQFDDYEHAKSALDGEVGEFVAEAFNDLGLEVLGWTANGFRVISSNRKIESMDDLEGLRLRLPNMSTFLKMGESLNVSVQPMALSEIFTALEQKVIDGQENPYATFKESGYYEVQSHVLESNHMFSPSVYLINPDFLASLDEETQQIIRAAATEAKDYEWELIEESINETKDFIVENGIEIVIPSEEFLEDMREAVKPMKDEIVEKYDWGTEYLELVEKYRK